MAEQAKTWTERWLNIGYFMRYPYLIGIIILIVVTSYVPQNIVNLLKSNFIFFPILIVGILAIQYLIMKYSVQEGKLTGKQEVILIIAAAALIYSVNNMLQKKPVEPAVNITEPKPEAAMLSDEPKPLPDIVKTPQISLILENSDMDIVIKYNRHNLYHGDIVSTIKYDTGQYELLPKAAEKLVNSLNIIYTSSLAGIIDKYQTNAEVLGVSDMIPVSEKAVYNGKKTIWKQRYFSINENAWKTISLIPQETPLTNEAIAFLRAYEVANYLDEIKMLKNAPIEISTIKDRAPGIRGAALFVKLRVKDVLKGSYEDVKNMEIILDNFGKEQGISIPKPVKEEIKRVKASKALENAFEIVNK